MSMNELGAAVKASATSQCETVAIYVPTGVAQSLTPHSRPKLAASRMGMSDATFWRKVKQGKIKVTKISERITVVAESEIQAMLSGERA